MNPELLKLRQTRADLEKATEAILNKSITVGTISDEDRATVDANKKQLANMDYLIQEGEEAEKRKAATATLLYAPENGGTTRDGSVQLVRDASDKGEKGWGFARAVMSLAASKGNIRDAVTYAEKTLRDERVSKALAASSATAGGFTVFGDMSSEIVELLRAKTVVRMMGARSVPMPKGSLTWPKLTGGSSASYIGENANISATEPDFGQLKLTAKKLACLVPISNDLIRYSAVGVESIVRDDMIAGMSEAEDGAFIRGAGTGSDPRGLRYWAPTANVQTVNGTVNLTNVTTDLDDLVLVVEESNAAMENCGWLMHPRTKTYLMSLRDGNGNYAFRAELQQGRLNGYKIGVTTSIPKNLAVTGSNESELYFVDFNDVVIGDVPEFILDVSDVAAYHNGSAVVAPFSLDQTVIRCIAQHDIGMRHDGSVALYKDVDWGA